MHPITLQRSKTNNHHKR